MALRYDITIHNWWPQPSLIFAGISHLEVLRYGDLWSERYALDYSHARYLLKSILYMRPAKGRLCYIVTWSPLVGIAHKMIHIYLKVKPGWGNLVERHLVTCIQRVDIRNSIHTRSAAVGRHQDDHATWKLILHNWPIVTGNHRSQLDSSQKGPVQSDLDIFWIVSMNKLVKKQSISQWFQMACWFRDITLPSSTYAHGCAVLCTLVILILMGIVPEAGIKDRDK